MQRKSAFLQKIKIILVYLENMLALYKCLDDEIKTYSSILRYEIMAKNIGYAHVQVIKPEISYFCCIYENKHQDFIFLLHLSKSLDNLTKGVVQCGVFKCSRPFSWSQPFQQAVWICQPVKHLKYDMNSLLCQSDGKCRFIHDLIWWRFRGWLVLFVSILDQFVSCLVCVNMLSNFEFDS